MKSIEKDLELYQEACDAYFKWCEIEWETAEQPGADDSEIGRKYIYLRNVNGLLAKYDIQKKTIMEGDRR